MAERLMKWQSLESVPHLIRNLIGFCLRTRVVPTFRFLYFNGTKIFQFPPSHFWILHRFKRGIDSSTIRHQQRVKKMTPFLVTSSHQIFNDTLK